MPARSAERGLDDGDGRVRTIGQARRPSQGCGRLPAGGNFLLFREADQRRLITSHFDCGEATGPGLGRPSSVS